MVDHPQGTQEEVQEDVESEGIEQDATSNGASESDSQRDHGSEEGPDTLSARGYLQELALFGDFTDDHPVMPLTIDESTSRAEPTPLHALSWRDESHPQWVRIKTVMDSGADESVAPPDKVSRVAMEESHGSKR